MTSLCAELGSVVVVIPTYNEAENLELIVSRIHGAAPGADILIVDDNSPDGTGVLADHLAWADRRIHALHRQEKSGLGSAYLAGFAWALDRGYGTVVEMDADGSHDPAELPGPAGFAAERRSGARLPVGARRRGAELAEVTTDSLPGRQRIRPAYAPHRHS